MRPNRLETEFVILAVLDGWGIAPESIGNAVASANLPNYHKLWSSYPHTVLRASGENVGLPRGEVGNTETGHLNLGAGRIVYQDLARINMSIADGSFFENKALIEAVDHVKKNNSKLHFMGLLGGGGVHSNAEHLFALLHLAALNKISKVFIHVFTDGRDSPPEASMTYIKRFLEVAKKEGVGEIATLMGRYWAMDRDQRWDRTAKAYFCLSRGEGFKAQSIEDAINQSYKRGITDEFIEPTIIVNADGNPKALVEDNDAVVFFNFRVDRPRQLSRAFVIEDLASLYQNWGFDPYAIEYQKKHKPKEELPPVVIHRGPKLNNLFFVMMTEYEKPLRDEGAKAAFPPEQVKMPLGRVIASYNLRQLRIAESEKERFVTYYFNGQVESPDIGEDRLIVPSPDVPTYDLKPEMSAFEMTEKLINKLNQANEYKFILVNFANPDMVGHTGNLEAAKLAVEAVDKCLGKLYQFVIARNAYLLITADHGNVEDMTNSSSGAINTEHSSNPVPFIAVSKNLIGKMTTLPSGILADVAPTILSILNLQIPQTMNGRNLLASLSEND